MAHVSPLKKKVVNEIVENVKKYHVVGVFAVDNLPSLQLQRMRANLRAEGAVLKVIKKNLILKAFEKVKDEVKGIDGLEKYLNGQVGLLYADENPFKLFKIIKKNKTTTFAKGGQVAPKDIVVKAGVTSFAPGPILGEMGSVGIKAGVEKGKVAIKQDAVVAKEGDVISPKLAEILRRLGIEPIEIGLNLKAVYEDGVIYDSKLLDVDEEEYLNKITEIASTALALSLGIDYPTKENAELLITSTVRKSKALASEVSYYSKDNIEEFVVKAAMHEKALSTD